MPAPERFVNPFVRIWADYYETKDLLSHFSEDVLSVTPELFDYPNVVLYGGAGTGKTMLFRYLSFDVQEVLFRKEAPTGGSGGDLARFSAARVKAKTGKSVPYFGIYRKLTEIPTAHFPNLADGEASQQLLFRFYLQIELSIKFLSCVTKLLFSHYDEAKGHRIEAAILSRLRDMNDSARFAKIGLLQESLWKKKQALDLALGAIHSPSQPSLQTLQSSWSSDGLVSPLFQLAECVKLSDPTLAQPRIFVLLDEYEAIPRSLKKVVNTLIRERNRFVEFKVGARRYGLETLDTCVAGDALIIGRDIELLDLEQMFRRHRGKYRELLADAAKRRLELWNSSPPRERTDIRRFLACESIEEQAKRIVRRNRRDREPEHRKRFRRYLERAQAPSVQRTVEAIKCDTNPIAEMLNMLLVKRRLASRHGNQRNPPQLDDSQIRTMCRQFLSDPSRRSPYHWLYKKNKSALLFQLANCYGRRAEKRKFAGFADFAQLSGGFIHLFLSLCYFSFEIARERRGFRTSFVIDVDSQNQAAEKVAQDQIRNGVYNIPGDGIDLYYFVLNLGAFFRGLHLDELLREPEPTYFITKTSNLEQRLQALLERAHQWSVLQTTPPMTPRKVGEPLPDVHILHPIFAPAFHISYAVRGRTKLDARQVGCLINGGESEIARLVEEFLRVSYTTPSRGSHLQQELFIDRR